MISKPTEVDGPYRTCDHPTGLWYRVPHFCHPFLAYSFHLQVVCMWRHLGVSWWMFLVGMDLMC